MRDGGRLVLSRDATHPSKTLNIFGLLLAKARSRRFGLVGFRRVAAALLALMAIAPCAVRAGSVNYEYDELGRLWRATYVGGAAVVYSYDASGNRTGEVVNAGKATLISGDLVFPSASFGATAPTRQLTFRNDGTAPIALGLTGLSGPFSVSQHTCHAVAPLATCVITVAMATNQVGTFPGQTVQVTGAVVSASIVASGAVNGSKVGVVSGDLNFGSVAQNSAPPRRTITLRNEGNVMMTLTGISGMSTPFTLKSNTCNSIAGGGTCQMTIEMATAAKDTWLQQVSTVGANVNLTGTVSGSTLGAGPDLKTSDLTILSVTAKPGGSYAVKVSYKVTNIGAATTGSWVDVGYLSVDGVLDNADQSQGYLGVHSQPLATGESYTATGEFTTTVTTAAGTYTFLVKADGRNSSTGGSNVDRGALAEIDELNNVASSPVKLDADLKVSKVSVGDITANSDGSYTIPVSYAVTNVGAMATAAVGWLEMGYLSVDGTLDNADQAGSSAQYLLASPRNTPLAPGQSFTVEGSFRTTKTTPAGSYTFFVKTDGRSTAYNGPSASNTDQGALTEVDEANNVVAVQVKLGADLKVDSVAPGTITANADGSYSISVNYTVTNVGTSTAAVGWLDMGYLSVNATLDNADQAGNSSQYLLSPARTTPLGPGQSYTVTGTFRTTKTTPSGSYTFFVKTDGRSAAYNGTGATNTDTGALTELDEANNVMAIPVKLDADLKVSNIAQPTVTANSDGSYTIAVDYTVTNAGTMATAAVGWVDMGYLSVDGVLDNADQAGNSSQYLLAPARSTPLGPGQSYTVTGIFRTTKTTPSGSYTFFVKTDGRSAAYNGTGATNTDTGALTELDEANNVMAIPVKLDADLKVSNIAQPTVTANSDGSYTIAVNYTVTNAGTMATAAVGWVDMGYLSVNATLDNADQAGNSSQYLLSPARTTPLGPGQSYTVTGTFRTTKTTPSGSYTFFVKTDGRSAAYNGTGATNTDTGALTELDEANNVMAIPVKLDADLKVSNISQPTITANSDGSYTIAVDYTVTNAGTMATAAVGWVDMGYLSVDGVLDNADQAGNSSQYLLAPARSTPLGPGQSYTVTGIFRTTKTTPSGSYTFFVKTDGRSAAYNGTGATNIDWGALTEPNEANNVAALLVVLPSRSGAAARPSVANEKASEPSASALAR
jgi:YD repeat-containing protein